MADPFEGWSDEPAAPAADPLAGWSDQPAQPVDSTNDGDGQLAATFDRALKQEPDKRAGVLRLARDLKIPSDVAEQKFDDFKASWEASQFDAKKWREANPTLARLALERPDLGEVVIRDQKLSALNRAVNWISDKLFDSTLQQQPTDDHIDQIKALKPGEAAKALKRGALPTQFTDDREQRDAPRPTAFTKDLESETASRSWVPFARYSETAAQMEISQLQFELLVKRASGADTFELEKKILDQKRGAVQRDYGEGEYEQVLTDVAQAAASQVAVYKDAGALGLVGAAGGALVGAAVTKTPAGAGAGALRGASILGKAGAALGSLRLEAGSAYGDLLQARTDDGKPLTEDQARGGALIYGGLASVVELASSAQLLRALGPLGAAFRKGTGKAAVAELMKDAGFRQIATRAGKEWLKSGLAEGGEEAVQSALEDLVTYVARSDAAGKLQKGPVIDVQKAITAAQKGAIGGLGMGGAAASINVATQLLARGKSQESAQRVAAIGELKGSPTVKAAPDVVASLIAETTAETGEPVTHVYVDPAALRAAVQDPAALAELLGEEGMQSLQAADATGGKLEVPIAKYLEGWVSTDLAAKLAAHTTTQEGHQTPTEMRENAPAIEEQAQALAEEVDAVEVEEAPSSEPASLADLRKAFESLPPEEQQRRYFTDANTGLLNSRGFREVPRDPARPFLAEFEVEGAKFLNDTQGHKAFDGALRTMAGVLQQNVPDGAQMGGSLRAWVREPQHAQQIAEAMSRAVGDGLRVTTAATHATEKLDESFEATAAAHKQLREAETKAGKLGYRKGAPASLMQGAPQIAFEEGTEGLPLESPEAQAALGRAASAAGPLAERLKAAKRVEGLALGETHAKAFEEAKGKAFDTVHREESGLLTDEGFRRAQELRPQPLTVSADLRGLRPLNQVFGREGADEILRVFSELMAQRLGQFDAAHPHGDEFFAQGADRQQIEKAFAALREQTESTVFIRRLPSGRVAIQEGLYFVHGVGNDLEEADRVALPAAKREQGRVPEARVVDEGALPAALEEFGRAGHFQLFDVEESLAGRVRPGDGQEEVAPSEISQAVARARQAMGLNPLFRSPAEAGMNPEQWATYLLEQKELTSHAVRAAEHRANKDLLRESTRRWKAEEAALRAAAAVEYEALPGRIAQQALKGTHPLVTEPIRLNRETVEAELGADVAREFRLAKDGVQPNEVAELLGFTTGAELLQAVASLPEKAAWTKEIARARMLERYPSLYEDREALREFVAKGLHGDQTAKWLLREWTALRSKLGSEAGPPIESIKRAAELLTERWHVGDIRPARNLRAERVAAEKAVRATARGDYAQAMVFVQQQLLNMYLYRSALEVREEMEAAEKYLEQRTSDTFRAGLGKASPDFLRAHDAILGALGFRQPSADIEEDLAALGRAEQIAYSDANPFAFDVDAIRGLIAEPRGWGELTPGEARNARDAVKNIRALANATNKITAAGEKVAVEEIATKIAEEAAQLPDFGKASASRQQVSLARQAADRVIGIHGELQDPEQIFDLLGPTARAIFERYLDAKTAKYALTAKVLNPMVKLWEALPKETLERRWEVIPELDTELPLADDIDLAGPRDRLWLLMVALNMGNASNRERLLGGFRWTEKQALDTLTKRLTKAEWEWVQSIWDLNDQQLWPAIAAKEERKTGLPPEKIRATPIVTPHGTFAGGYHAAKYDPRASAGDIGERQAESSLASLYGPGYVRGSTAKSHTKKRAEHYENVINLDWSVVPAHIAQVLHDVAFDEYVRDTGRIIFHLKVKQTLFRRLGEKRSTEPRDWLKFVANAQANSGAVRSSELAKLLGGLKGRMVGAAIGWSVPVALSDFSNAFVAMARGREAGGTSAHFGMLAYVAALPISPSFPAIRRMALERSSELRNRAQSYSEERRQEMLRNIGKKRGKLTRAIEAVANTRWYLLEMTDRMSSTQIWLARFWEEKRSGASPSDASRLADAAVRANLPGPERSELPALLRDPGAVGSLLTFYGYMSKMMNVLGALGRRPVIAITKAKRTGEAGDYAAAALVTARYTGRALAVMFAFNVLGELVGGRGKDDEESYEEWLARKMLAAPVNVLPFGSSLEPAISKAVTGRAAPFSDRSAPALSFVANIYKSIGKVADEDLEDDARVWAAIEVALTAAKLPARQPRKTLGYLDKFLSGDDTENIADFASGVGYGKRTNQPANPFSLLGDAIEGR